MIKRKTSTAAHKYKLVLSAVHMVYRLVNSTFNEKELLSRLTRLVCQLIGANSSSVYILDRSKKRIVLMACFNGKVNKLFEKKGAYGRVNEEEWSVTMGRSIYRPRVIGIPLVADDNVGAIFVRRKNRDVPFTDFDKELLNVIAEQVVTAIKNLQLYQNQQKIILGSIKSLGKMMEKQSRVKVVHAPNYFNIVRSLGDALAMRRDEIESLQYASILRDAGVMDVPFDILSKSSQLSPDEFKQIRNHPAKSVELIKPVEFLKPILPIILYHHEKYDGTGYPSGLKKEQIPLGARVMAVADAFEAMTRGRPYKKALTIPEALAELQKNSGSQFDPKVVKVFLKLSKEKKFRKYLSLLKK